MIKKNLINIQLDLELSKFEEQQESQSSPTGEKIFESTLQKLVIEPYGQNLLTTLNEIFIELNFNDSLVMLLKDNKKIMKKRNVSASKKFEKSP